MSLSPPRCVFFGHFGQPKASPSGDKDGVVMNNAQFAQLVRQQTANPAKRRKTQEEQPPKGSPKADAQQTRNESKVQDGRRGLDLEAVRRAKAALSTPKAATKQEANDVEARLSGEEDEGLRTGSLQHDEAIESKEQDLDDPQKAPEDVDGVDQALEEAFKETNGSRSRDAILAEYKANHRLKDKRKQMHDALQPLKGTEKVVLIMDDFGRVRRQGRKGVVESIPTPTIADDAQSTSTHKETHTSRDIFDDEGDYDPLKNIREKHAPSHASTDSASDEDISAMDDDDRVNQKREELNRDEYDMDMYSSDG